MILILKWEHLDGQGSGSFSFDFFLFASALFEAANMTLEYGVTTSAAGLDGFGGGVMMMSFSYQGTRISNNKVMTGKEIQTASDQVIQRYTGLQIWLPKPAEPLLHD